MIIRMRDIRAAKMCSRGTRDFFLRHGLDWGDFLKNGIEAQKLWDTEDPMARQVVDLARKNRST